MNTVFTLYNQMKEVWERSQALLNLCMDIVEFILNALFSLVFWGVGGIVLYAFLYTTLHTLFYGSPPPG